MSWSKQLTETENAQLQAMASAGSGSGSGPNPNANPKTSDASVERDTKKSSATFTNVSSEATTTNENALRPNASSANSSLKMSVLQDEEGNQYYDVDRELEKAKK